MRSQEIVALFDSQAENYNAQWANLSPISDGLYFLLDSVFAALPKSAALLCVGAGTGNEIHYLANRFPGWNFTIVEPSEKMLNVCRRSLSELDSRCEYHCGFIESLPHKKAYDAATSILVSHFITDRQARTRYFHDIASHLATNAMLVSADLCADQSSPLYETELRIWFNTVARSGNTELSQEKLRQMYASDVAVLPSTEVKSFITEAGFSYPITFFQSGLIHTFCAQRT